MDTSGRPAPRARFTTHGETTDLELAIDDTGQLRAVSLKQWGQKDRGAFGYRTFGGVFDEERTFDGYALTTRLRVGWGGSENLGAWNGEFFRATIDEAKFR